MKKKKVLFLSVLPPPYYGSSVICKEILEILNSERNLEVRHIQLNYSKKMNDVGKINLRKIKGIYSVRKKINSTLKEFNPDIVYFAPATTGLGLIRDSYFARYIKRKKYPILYHIHSRISSSFLKNKLQKKLLRNMLENEEAIVLGEELIGDVSWVINKENITVLPNATRNKVSDKQLKEIFKNRSKNNEPHIIFLSNMIESKGWPKLLEACNIINQRRINFKCTFVGGWPSKIEEEKFNSYVRENLLEGKVFSKGSLTGKPKDKILESADIFVFPTEYPLETFGLVITETMMYAIPTIANSIATIPSIVEDGKTGYLLKKNTPREIANYLEELINDPRKRKNLGKSARRRFLKKFEQTPYKKKIVSLIYSLAKN